MEEVRRFEQFLDVDYYNKMCSSYFRFGIVYQVAQVQEFTHFKRVSFLTYFSPKKTMKLKGMVAAFCLL